MRSAAEHRMVFGADGASNREQRRESEAPLRCAVGLPVSHPPSKRRKKGSTAALFDALVILRFPSVPLSAPDQGQALGPVGLAIMCSRIVNVQAFIVDRLLPPVPRAVMILGGKRKVLAVYQVQIICLTDRASPKRNFVPPDRFGNVAIDAKAETINQSNYPAV